MESASYECLSYFNTCNGYSRKPGSTCCLFEAPGQADGANKTRFFFFLKHRCRHLRCTGPNKARRGWDTYKYACISPVCARALPIAEKRRGSVGSQMRSLRAIHRARLCVFAGGPAQLASIFFLFAGVYCSAVWYIALVFCGFLIELVSFFLFLFQFYFFSFFFFGSFFCFFFFLLGFPFFYFFFSVSFYKRNVNIFLQIHEYVFIKINIRGPFFSNNHEHVPAPSSSGARTRAPPPPPRLIHPSLPAYKSVLFTLSNPTTPTYY